MANGIEHCAAFGKIPSGCKTNQKTGFKYALNRGAGPGSHLTFG